MAKNSAIGWTDHTFNPWHGCQKVDEECLNCYAESFSKRVGRDIWGPPAHTSRLFFGDEHWAEPITWDAEAAEAGERRRVFCASMADVFEDHPDVEWPRMRLLLLVEATRHLDWLLLTKRPENVMSVVRTMVPDAWCRAWPAHVWVGTSVGSQQSTEKRIPPLLAVPAPIRFLSCEPLIGPIDLSPWLARIAWVILGGETGPRHRPMDLAWLEGIVEQCRAAGVPVFVKQDSGQWPGRQGRIPDALWALKQFPAVEPTTAVQDHEGVPA